MVNGTYFNHNVFTDNVCNRHIGMDRLETQL